MLHQMKQLLVDNLKDLCYHPRLLVRISWKINIEASKYKKEHIIYFKKNEKWK